MVATELTVPLERRVMLPATAPVTVSVATPATAAVVVSPVTVPGPAVRAKVMLSVLSGPEVTVLPEASSMVAVKCGPPPRNRREIGVETR